MNSAFHTLPAQAYSSGSLQARLITALLPSYLDSYSGTSSTRPECCSALAVTARSDQGKEEGLLRYDIPEWLSHLFLLASQ
jgi:hypothetical protein